MGIRKHIPNDNFFSKPNLLNSYWAGFIAADGYVTKNRFAICLSEKDKNHLLEFKRNINFNGNIELTVPNRGLPAYRIRFTSLKICEDLKKNFNITPRKSLTLKPPKGLTKKQALAYIVGYIDGDGCIYKRSIYSSLGIKILGTAQILKYIVHTLNKVSVLSNKTVRKADNIFQWSMESKNTIIILNKLKNINVPKLDRKWNKV